jgi:hypothetical protein
MKRYERLAMAGFGRRFFMAVTLACGWLGGLAGAGGGQLLKNGGFDQIMVGWSIPNQLVPWIPYLHPAGKVSLHPMEFGYNGVVLRQALNVTGIAGQTVAGAIDLGSDWQMPEGNTVVIYIKYIDNTGSEHSQALIRPANSAVPVGSMSTFTGGFTFPANAAKLVSLEIAKESFGEAMADNISLTSATLVPSAVPRFDKVEPSVVAYGQSFTITGNGFAGAVAPEVLLNGSAGGLQVTAWTNTSVTVMASTPAASGALELKVGGTRCSELRQLTISSPHCVLEMGQSSFQTIAGMPVDIPVWVDMRNGYSPVGGLSLQVLKGASVVPSVVAPQVTRTGGTFVRIQSSSLTPGNNRLRIRGSGGGYTTADSLVDVTLEVAASGSFSVDGVAVTSYTSTTQGVRGISLNRLNSAGQPLLTQAPITWTSTKPAVCEVFVDSGWGGNQLLLHGSGAATVKATTPDGMTYNLPITVNLPASPRILTFAVSPASMDNSGTMAGEVVTVLNVPITSSSISYPNGIVLGDYTYGPDNQSITRSLSTTAGMPPGVYKLDTTASSMQRSTKLMVYNAAGKGLVTGRIMRFGGFDAYMHLMGNIEFYDAGGNKVTPGAGDSDLMISAFGTNVYQAAYLDPGVYRIRWVDEITKETKWWPNANSFAEAAPVTVAANTVTSGVDFFFGEKAKTPPVQVGSPVRDAVTRTLDISIQTVQGESYQLQRSESMQENTWYPITEIWGDGTILTLRDTAATGAKAFYRVLSK